ncbi:MAG: hypothetical protein DMF80_08670 [Acidobacteria bacterium]|nr:MAG: hypothetical protein DMF80_08670 [Acidobacteriota bacterium]
MGGGERGARRWRRPAAFGLALGLAALLVGDRGRTANAVQGIDPLEILNEQVKPNVLFVIDSAVQMGFTDDLTHYVGGDDAQSRFFQVKEAVRELVRENDGRANFGIVDLSADLTQLGLNYNGPLVYVSLDATAATWDGFFDNISTTPANYDASLCGGGVNPVCSQAIFRGLGNADNPSGTTNPPGNINFSSAFRGLHYIQSRLFRNNVRYTFNSNSPPGLKNASMTGIGPTTCPAPSQGLLGDDTDAFNDGAEARPCFEIADTSTGQVARYYYSSGTFGEISSNAAVPGVVVPVPACTAPSNLTSLNNALKLEMPLDASGNPVGLNPGSNVDLTAAPNSQPNTAGGGMRLGRRRLFGTALSVAQSHFSNVVFPARPGAVTGLQKNFVILIAGNNSAAGDDPVPVASSMFSQGGGNQIQTLVVSFNGRVSPPFDPTTLNALQSAGSGGTRPTVFGAATAEELKASLNYAFSLTIASGTFSTESSITESIYEYTARAGAFDPNDPQTRYGGRVPILLQSSFDMPGFNGHLKAFVNQSGVSTQLWDAGQKLRDRVWNGPNGADGMCPGAADFTTCLTSPNRTFAELRGTTDPVGPLFQPASDAHIKRRIFTSQGNGVFPYSDTSDQTFPPATRQLPVLLWPPSSSTTGLAAPFDVPVAPSASNDPPGALDVQLGIAGLVLADLQSEFGACLGTIPALTPLHPCDPGSSITLQTNRARREAREMILAYMAGAAVATDANGLPLRNGSGDIFYRAKDWILAESTLAVPAVIPPPLEARPIIHTAEYLLFRDGIRDSAGNVTGSNALVAGFGLRNPDRNTSPSLASDPSFKPLMSVVYHAANDMLHALRAGPCPANTCVGGRTETGGEELWGFVPYDQLGKLAERMQGQGRVPHTFMVAASVRFTDIFVPDPSGYTINGRSFQGHWRTNLVIGRGIGGTYYTSLDVTAPERFNRSALDTNLPYNMWSRGNPDTQDGTPTGAANALTDPTGDEGDVDGTAYAKMGETWSVPSIAAVASEFNFGKEFALFSGSGYSDDPTATNRGKTFFVIDALTGDVLYAKDLPSTLPNTTAGGDTTLTCAGPLLAGETCPVPNALVANTAAYVAVQLAPGFVGNPAASTASLVYLGDLHGRMWKYVVSSPSVGMVRMWDAGPDQPIGSSAALLNISDKPHVYFETGNDLRVLPPPNFRMYAVQDEFADRNPASCDTVDPASATLVNCGPTTRLFRFDFENSFASFRGTAQPASAFNAQNNGRVFFIGTKFNDQNVSGGDCLPNFDSVLFAVGAQTGGAVYDLDASGTIGANEREIKIGGTKVNALRGAMGQIVLDRGEVGNSAPPAPPAPGAAPTANEGSSGEVFVVKLKTGSAVCR